MIAAIAGVWGGAVALVFLRWVRRSARRAAAGGEAVRAVSVVRAAVTAVLLTLPGRVEPAAVVAALFGFVAVRTLGLERESRAELRGRAR